jgi:hypothetical protein
MHGRLFVVFLLLAALAMSARDAQAAETTYWNLFNAEDDFSDPANFVTYATLEDMLLDVNRTGVFVPDGFSAAVAGNIVDAGSDGTTFWLLGNQQGVLTDSAQFATYATFADMLGDTNRIALFTPDGFSAAAARNIIGTGSDGTTYWVLGNAEGISDPAQFATYDSLMDMLNDENRTGLFTPDGFSVAAAGNIVSAGSDGTTYWLLGNAEGNASDLAQFATYSSLLDMLNDENRIGLFTPNGHGQAARLIGSGVAFGSLPPRPVPLPPTFVLVASGLLALKLRLRRSTGRPGRASR